MSRAPHSPSKRLAVVALARLSGPEEAARVGKVDVRTVRTWMADAATDNPSLADWQASRDFAKEQELRAALSGNAALAFAWSKSAGVGQRNLNYERQVARQGEQVMEADPDELSPEAQQYARLDVARNRLLVAEVRVITGRRELGLDPMPPNTSDDAVLEIVTQMVDEALALDDDAVGARTAALQAERAELDRLALERIEAERLERHPPPRGYETAVDVTPRAPETPTEAPQREIRSPMLIDVGAEDHDRTWERIR